jgi:hypothetical protein
MEETETGTLEETGTDTETTGGILEIMDAIVATTVTIVVTMIIKRKTEVGIPVVLLASRALCLRWIRGTPSSLIRTTILASEVMARRR